MNVLLAIPSRGQNKYLPEMLEAIGNMSVMPGHVLYMADRPTSTERADAVRVIGNNPTVEYYPVSGKPKYVGRPAMCCGVDWFLAGHVRNAAIKYFTAHSEFDAVVFIDGDCIPEKDLVKSHTSVLESKSPTVSVGKRKEAQYGWDDQRCKDPDGINIFHDSATEITDEMLFVDSGVLWSCNAGLNRTAVESLKQLNNELYGRDEVFSSDFLGTWGGEDGFLGMECLYSGIKVMSLENGDNGIRHKMHERDESKYDHVAFIKYLEDQRKRLMYLMRLNGNDCRGFEYVPREVIIDNKLNADL